MQAEVAERHELVEREGAEAVELEHGQETCDHDTPEVGTRDELAERERVDGTQHPHHVSRLLTDADQRRVQVVEPHRGQLARGQRESGQGGEVGEGEGPDQLGRLAAELLFQPHRATVPGGLALEPALEPGAGALEGTVLQQPGEQQVAGLEQGHVFRIDELTLRQQPDHLEVEQSGRDHEELRRLVELLVLVEAA